MKLKPDPIRTFFSYLILGICTSGAFYLTLGYPYNPFRPLHIILLTIPTIIALGFVIYALKMNYFSLEKKRIVFHRGKKELFYYYSEIIYIDHDYSRYHKSVRFYTNKGDERFLPLDKDRLVYKRMCEECNHLLSFEDLKKRFPKAKF